MTLQVKIQLVAGKLKSKLFFYLRLFLQTNCLSNKMLRAPLTYMYRSVPGKSISDHLSYYGIEMGCDEWSSCRIVMDPRVKNYGTTDLKGNIVLSRNSTAILKLNTESEPEHKLS